MDTHARVWTTIFANLHRRSFSRLITAQGNCDDVSPPRASDALPEISRVVNFRLFMEKFERKREHFRGQSSADARNKRFSESLALKLQGGSL